jgi:cholesterol transport system auxiliary component
MLKKFKTGFAVCLFALLTQGCLQPIDVPEAHQHQLLVSSPICCGWGSKTCRTLFISLPQATQPYNSTKMVYSQRPCEISWFAQNRWVTPLPQMILPLMVQSLRNTHHFRAVAGFPTVACTDYRLDTSIITFKQEFCGQRSRVHIVLDATLIFSRTQSIVATRRIEVCVPTLCNTPESGVAAYQCAFNKVLKQLAGFIICS